MQVATTSRSTDRGSYNWLITAYTNPVPNFNRDATKFFIVQEETCPSTGRRHWQGVIQLKNSVTMSALKRNILKQNAHVEVMRGTIDDAVAYCTKLDNDPRWPGKGGRINGTEVFQYGRLQKQGQRNDIHEAVAAVAEGMNIGTFAATYPHILMKYPNGVKTLMSTLGKDSVPEWRTVRVFVVFGDSGTGKSGLPQRRFPPPCTHFRVTYDRMPGRVPWFDGYGGEQSIICDEFQGQFPVEFLLKLTDGHPHDVEIKGGQIRLNHTMVWMISNIHPQNWYLGIDPRHWAALSRRFATGGWEERKMAEEDAHHDIPHTVKTMDKDDIAKEIADAKRSNTSVNVHVAPLNYMEVLGDDGQPTGSSPKLHGGCMGNTLGNFHVDDSTGEFPPGAHGVLPADVREPAFTTHQRHAFRPLALLSSQLLPVGVPPSHLHPEIPTPDHQLHENAQQGWGSRSPSPVKPVSAKRPRAKYSRPPPPPKTPPRDRSKDAPSTGYMEVAGYMEVDLSTRLNARGNTGAPGVSLPPLPPSPPIINSDEEQLPPDDADEDLGHGEWDGGSVEICCNQEGNYRSY